jgi:RNA polymerase sigma-70 factor (ECF subfamily)
MTGLSVGGGARILMPVMHEDDAANSDEILMQRYRDGDAGAFDRLYARHKGGLFRYVLRQCGNRSVAEELFQEIWMKLIGARHTYTVRAKFTTYLYTLAHHRLIDHYRTQRGGVTLSFDDDDGPYLEALEADRASDPAQQADTAQQAQQLLNLIAALPAPQREAFLLQQEAGMSVEAIAQTTGVSRETAKSRLRYALSRLRQGAQELS